MTRRVEHLDLRGATLFGQDWGGLIGTRVVAENERRFARLVRARALAEAAAHALGGDLCPFTHMDLGREFQSRVPGARLLGIEHKRFAASHFSQEDAGAELAAEIVRRFPPAPSYGR